MSDTSRESFAVSNNTTLPGQLEQAVVVLHAKGARGLTADELIDAMGLEGMDATKSASSRMSQLKRCGAAYDSGVRRKSRYGRKVMVYRYNENWDGSFGVRSEAERPAPPPKKLTQL
jgi:hypothetical protein